MIFLCTTMLHAQQEPELSLTSKIMFVLQKDNYGNWQEMSIEKGGVDIFVFNSRIDIVGTFENQAVYVGLDILSEPTQRTDIGYSALIYKATDKNKQRCLVYMEIINDYDCKDSYLSVEYSDMKFVYCIETED